MAIVSVPTPDEAAQLRTLFELSPAVDAAEQALRAWNVDLSPETAATLLDGWRHTPALSPRERRAVIARFVG